MLSIITVQMGIYKEGGGERGAKYKKSRDAHPPRSRVAADGTASPSSRGVTTAFFLAQALRIPLETKLGDNAATEIGVESDSDGLFKCLPLLFLLPTIEGLSLTMKPAGVSGSDTR